MPDNQYFDEITVEFTVTGHGSSYKKAVNHAIESADTAYQKKLYGADCKYEDYQRDIDVRYELVITGHTVTWSYERDCRDDGRSHFVTANGKAIIKRWK